MKWGEEGGNRHLNAKIVKKQADLFVKCYFFGSQIKTGNEGESFKEPRVANLPKRKGNCHLFYPLYSFSLERKRRFYKFFKVFRPIN
jgi:hypothetical protein